MLLISYDLNHYSCLANTRLINSGKYFSSLLERHDPNVLGDIIVCYSPHYVLMILMFVTTVPSLTISVEVTLTKNMSVLFSCKLYRAMTVT